MSVLIIIIIICSKQKVFVFGRWQFYGEVEPSESLSLWRHHCQSSLHNKRSSLSKNSIILCLTNIAISLSLSLLFCSDLHLHLQNLITLSWVDAPFLYKIKNLTTDIKRTYLLQYYDDEQQLWQIILRT